MWQGSVINTSGSRCPEFGNKKKQNKKPVVVTLSPSVPDTISDKRGQVQFAKYSLPLPRASDIDYIVRSFPFISNEKKYYFSLQISNADF